MLSKELESALTVAVNEVKRRNHEFLTLEHLLYAISIEDQGEEILEVCGAEMEKLRDQLGRFFVENMEALPEGTESEVIQTLGVRRVLQRAVWQKKASGKSIVEVGDVLAAMFDEEDSYAVYFLRTHDVSRLDILEFISHGMSAGDEWNSLSGDGAPQPNPLEARPGDKKSPLEEYTVNLTNRAAGGFIDPLIGRSRSEERRVGKEC